MSNTGNEKKNKIEKGYLLIGEETSKGRIQITEECVSHIATLAALEVEGIAGVGSKFAMMAPSSVPADTKVFIRDKNVQVYLTLSVDYGFSIPIVSSSVQEKVKFMIENMTGYTVLDVNIRISGIAIK